MFVFAAHLRIQMSTDKRPGQRYIFKNETATNNTYVLHQLHSCVFLLK